MTPRAYFDVYTKRPEGDRRAMTEMAYRKRWELLEGAHDVLDVGFGGGVFMDVAPAGVRVLGVDSDEAAVASRSSQAFLGNAADLPFDSASFDAVHAAHVIEHMPEPDRLVAECARVLRPGGKLIVATPDIERYKFGFWVDHTHVRPFTEISLRTLLAMHGFETLHMGQGLARQTRVEEMSSRFPGVTLERRYALRTFLGRWLGKELIAVARLTA
jgi:SAM-dependent methyltransferase